MKVLLVNPPIDHMVRSTVPDFVNAQLSNNPMPPLGLMYLAAYIEAGGCKPKILDMVADKTGIHELKQEIWDYKPDMVGITATTLTFYDAVQVAKAVKEIDDIMPVVIGGAHCNVYPEETAAFECFDYVVRGEGELLLSAIIDGEQDEVVSDVIPFPNLDMLPFPARHLTDINKYRSTISKDKLVTSAVTSRGCPFHCAFCYQPHYGNKWRARSAENVVAEIEECINLGIGEIEIYDDTFTYDRQRVIDICLDILGKNLKIDWAIRTRVDKVDKELLRFMSKAGCKRINYGIESANPEVLKMLRKGITPEQSVEAVRMTKEAGIEVQAYFMIGSPRETKEQIMNTIAFANRLNPDYCYYSITSPCPATLLYTLGMREGKFDDYWRDFAKNPTADFKARFWDDLPRDELIGLMEYGFKSFYLRPSFILKQLAKVRSFDDLMQKAKVMLAMK